MFYSGLTFTLLLALFFAIVVSLALRPATTHRLTVCITVAASNMSKKRIQTRFETHLYIDCKKASHSLCRNVRRRRTLILEFIKNLVQGFYSAKRVEFRMRHADALYARQLRLKILIGKQYQAQNGAQPLRWQRQQNYANN